MSLLEQLYQINDDARLGFITCAEAFYLAKDAMKRRVPSVFSWEVFCDKYKLDYIAAGVCECHHSYYKNRPIK